MHPISNTTHQWVVATAVVLVLTACGGPEVAETPEPAATNPPAESALEATVDELTLPVEVRLALLDELGIDGLRIETTVDRGTVTLGGTVHEPESQIRAEEIVAAIDGVEEVVSTVVVAPSEDLAPDDDTADELEMELSDALLEGEVALRLYAALGADAAALEVEVVDGSVTLRGVVDETNEKTEAVAAAEAVDGADQVVDLIEVADPVEARPKP